MSEFLERVFELPFSSFPWSFSKRGSPSKMWKPAAFREIKWHQLWQTGVRSIIFYNPHTVFWPGPGEGWLCSGKNIPWKVQESFHMVKNSFYAHNKPGSKPHKKGNLGTIIFHVLWTITSKESQRKCLSLKKSSYDALFSPYYPKVPWQYSVGEKRS